LEKDRKQQILKAAEKRFSRHGLNKTTLNEIARDLRIGKATIYHYFATKEELFFRTIEWEIDLYLEELKPIFLNEQLDLKGKLAEYFCLKLSAFTRFKLIYEVLFCMMKEEVLNEEVMLVKILFEKETDFLKQYLPGKKEKQLESSYNIVLSSWGEMLSNKIKTTAFPEMNLSEQYLLNFIESIYP
jgi:AcrR family transcriptional regulator